ncbi:MAG: Apocarotenoid-15,15'-oxygenase [Oscillatoriales cyanobacterium SM2_2_1]|nr:Apocarotenoid-15,15'-oxygenase [Oscillatoriales cyanobacterium SM2_2_1]
MSTSTSTFNRADWQQGYTSLATESSYWIEQVEGELPQSLQGTLFRNGPGLLDRNGVPYGHPFDGDGMVVAVTFTGDRAHFQNRFVQTPGYLAEQRADKILYRGVFGTQKPGGWIGNCFDLRLKNIANTNVISQGDRLWALWEAARPYRLDPETLETLGEEDFNGMLAAGQTFTAHPKLDPITGSWWGFGVQPGPRSVITLYEITQTGTLQQHWQRRVPGFCFLHDFAFTPNYQVFLQNPVNFAPLPYLLGWRTAGECLELKPNTPSKFLIFDRQGDLVEIETDSCFVFHHANAYEEGGRLIVDSVCYADYPKLEPGTDYKQVNFDQVVPGKLYRFIFDVERRTVERQPLLLRSCEFPTVSPRSVGQPYRYAYLGMIAQEQGNAPLQVLVKLDTQTGSVESQSFAPRGFIGEPVFVPHPESTAEDHGWVLSLVFDAARGCSKVVILDARRFGEAPVAVVYLRHHVPYGLHGNFTHRRWR